MSTNQGHDTVMLGIFHKALRTRIFLVIIMCGVVGWKANLLGNSVTSNSFANKTQAASEEPAKEPEKQSQPLNSGGVIGQASRPPGGGEADKAFEVATTLAQSLTQWALLIAGGSLVILVGTSYYRPTTLRVRAAYLLFAPGWVLLAASMYYGSQVQRAYLGYLFYKIGKESLSPDRVTRSINTITSDAYHQLLLMQIALVVFGAWVSLYFIWWVFSRQFSNTEARR